MAHKVFTSISEPVEIKQLELAMTAELSSLYAIHNTNYAILRWILGVFKRVITH